MATYLKPRRRWLWPVAGFMVFLAAGAIALVILYPRLGASLVRGEAHRGQAGDQARPRRSRSADVDVSFGHAVLRDLEIRGALDGDTPLVHVDRVDVDFDAPGTRCVGTVELGAAIVDGVIVALRRDADGTDNVRDIIDRLRGEDAAAAVGERWGETRLRGRPRSASYTASCSRTTSSPARPRSSATATPRWTAEKLVAAGAQRQRDHDRRAQGGRGGRRDPRGTDFGRHAVGDARWRRARAVAEDGAVGHRRARSPRIPRRPGSTRSTSRAATAACRAGCGPRRARSIR